MITKPFSHPGGKTNLARRIMALFPGHKCYCEPFCGSAALFWQKPRATVEVLNDTNGDIANCFRCLQRHADAVKQELHLAVNSRAHFYALRDNKSATDIQRAAAFIILKALSFGADGESFGVQRGPGGGAANNLGSFEKKIYDFHERLQGVIIENKDWEQCVKTYDGPETFFYLDPPYTQGKIKAYINWGQKEVLALAGMLRGIIGKCLVSLNDTLFNRKAFRGFHISSFKRPRGIKPTLKPFGELLIRNY